MSLRIIVSLAFLVNLVASTWWEDGFSKSAHEVLRVDGGIPGVVWAVQVSDIHISKWIPERGQALRRALGHALKLIKPVIVLITGDLTEAKNHEKTASQQYEEEWIEYRDSFQKVVDDSGIPLRRFNDLRGNHDKYGVPPSSKLDYFSKYSISAALNRSSLVQSVTIEGRDGQKHLFIGFDDSVTVGLRSPSNAFGHPTDEILAQLDMALKRWEDATGDGVTKIVYGHFPLSFTTSTESGKRLEEVMANNNVTAYLCGHLHKKFGRRLYKRHINRNGEFWEWEVGDWRSSRMLRVLAIDNGDASFVDVELIPPHDNSEKEYIMPIFILQTYPLDSRFMLRSSGKVSMASNSIRALVFSETIPISVIARTYDSTFRPPKLVDESLMKLFRKGQRGAYYYTAPWQPERYGHSSGLRYAMQIVVGDKSGSIHQSEMRFFSVEGNPGEFHLAPLAFLFLGFPWERAFHVLLWSMIFFLVASLLIPRIFLNQLQKRGGYEEWVTSFFTPASTASEAIQKILRVPYWIMVEGARNRSLWAGMMTYMLSLIIFPWFSGRVLGDDYPLGHMSLHGWTVMPYKADPGQSLSGLGIPDIMGIVLPYIYTVVFPLWLLLPALSAERAACEFHVGRLEKLQKKKKKTNREVEASISSSTASDNESSLAQAGVAGLVKEETRAQEESEAPFSEKRRTKLDHCCLCKRFLRKGLFVGCLLIAYNHWQLCSTLLGAYGPMALVAGPAYAWGVPALLMFTIFQTSQIRSKPACHEH